jgi:hypothetical protein
VSHPHFHALSSARTHGGEGADYTALHAWFDASKQAYADTRHRAVLHHTFGVTLLLDRFGPTLTRVSDGQSVELRLIGAQHLEEDCGFHPALADWLGQRPLEPWIARAATPIPQSRLSAQQLGGVPEDYEPLHRWLDQGTASWDDPRAHGPLHSAFGIFLAEHRFGATFARPSDGRPVPTRVAAEAHVIRAHGHIPTVEQWMARIPVEPWMRRGATPLSRILERAAPLLATPATASEAANA